MSTKRKRSQTEKEALYLEHIRERCKSFVFFARYFFKHKYKKKLLLSAHHIEICETLEAVHRGEITHLIVNMPPRYGKTEFIVKLFSAWCFSQNPACVFLHLSYSDKLASSNSDAIRELVKLPAFAAVFPQVRIKTNKDGQHTWATTEDGLFNAASAGGSVTGFGAGSLTEFNPETGQFVFHGAILIDDPLKPTDAISTPKRTFVNARWDSTIKNRRNSDKTPVIVVMQRLHDEDFCAVLLEDSEFNWHHLKLPAILNEGTDDERALWPEKDTLERLQAQRTKNAPVFSAQMQQSPSVVGGTMFKDEYWRYYNTLPGNVAVTRIYVDTAQKTKEHNDFSVFQAWAFVPNMGIFLIDQMRGKWEAPDLEKNLLTFWDMHKADIYNPCGASSLLIEDKSSGSSLIQRISANSTIPVIPVQRNVDKVFRAYGAIPYIAAGKVFIPESAPWLQEFLQEHARFSPLMTHKHDDQIDCTMSAVEDILVNGALFYSDAAVGAS